MSSYVLHILRGFVTTVMDAGGEGDAIYDAVRRAYELGQLYGHRERVLPPPDYPPGQFADAVADQMTKITWKTDVDRAHEGTVPNKLDFSEITRLIARGSQ